MKRILGLGVVAALALPLAACGGSNSTAPATPKPSVSVSVPGNASVPPAQPPGSNAPQGMTPQKAAAKVNQLRTADLAKHKKAPQLTPPGATTAAVGNARATEYSGNWSGFVAPTSSAFSAVSGNWTQPKATCLTQSYAVWWVGLDGWYSGSVEQDGSAAYCGGAGQTPYYFTWWELYPQNSIQGVAQINYGDRIAATVNYKGSNHYQMLLTDSSRHSASFNKTVTKSGGAASRNSSEWIVEAPGGSGGQFPLTKYATTTMTSSRATWGVSRYANSYTHASIYMWPYSQVIATVKGLYSGGKFYDYWHHSY